jgi:hypothetical protein
MKLCFLSANKQFELNLEIEIKTKFENGQWPKTGRSLAQTWATQPVAPPGYNKWANKQSGCVRTTNSACAVP